MATSSTGARTSFRTFALAAAAATVLVLSGSVSATSSGTATPIPLPLDNKETERRQAAERAKGITGANRAKDENNFVLPLVNFNAKLKGPFRKYPMLQCSACETIVSEISSRVNKTLADHKERVEKGHRIDDFATTKGGNKHRKQAVDYETSDLRVLDVLDDLCGYVRARVRLAMTKNGIRLLTNNAQIFPDNATLYDDTERRDLSHPKGRVYDMCEQMLDRHEELLSRVIKRAKTMSFVRDEICEKGLRVCDTKMNREWQLDEMHRFERFIFHTKGFRDTDNVEDDHTAADFPADGNIAKEYVERAREYIEGARKRKVEREARRARGEDTEDDDKEEEMLQEFGVEV
jgi:hypothetical protein